MLKLSDRDVGYLAGLLDGEGCISLSRKKLKSHHEYGHSGVTQIYNSYLPVLDWCREKTGIGQIEKHTHLKVNHKVAFRWRLRQPEIVEFLPVVLPALIIKQRQAELLLEFYSKCFVREEGTLTSDAFYLRLFIYDELKALNRKGREE